MVADGDDYQKIYKRKKAQKVAAYVLMMKAGFSYREFSIADLPKFEKVSVLSARLTLLDGMSLMCEVGV